MALPALARYENPIHGWSVDYPDGWSVDSTDPAHVLFLPSPDLPRGLLGIHAGPVPFGSADEMADSLFTIQGRGGSNVRILDRRRMLLADSTPALEVVSQLGVGVVGQSRRIFVLVDGTAYVIDAETYRDEWPRLEPHFRRMIDSLTLPARSP